MTTTPDPEPAQGQGLWVLTASSSVEAAFASQSPNGALRSLFTGAIIDGLRSGDADLDRDGLISIDDLYRYVSDRLREQARRQKPQMRADHVSGQLYIARSRVAAKADGTPVTSNATANMPPTTLLPPTAVRVLNVGVPVTALSAGELGGRSSVTAACEDGTLRVWDLAAGEPSERRLSGHSGPVWGVVVGPVDGRPIAVSAGDDQTLRQWDLATGAEAGPAFVGHTALVNSVALASFGDRAVVVSASDDHTIRRWELPAASMIGRPLDAHTDWVNAVTVISSPDGNYLIVSGSSDKTVRVWDLQEAQLLQTLTGHTDSVSSVSATFLPAGQMIAVTGSTDETVRVWTLESGENLRTLTGHSGRVRAVALGDLDGRPIVVSGGNDGTVRVWDLADDQAQPLILTDHNGPVRAVTVGAVDGQTVVVSGGDDGTVRVWTLTGQQPSADQVEWLSDAPARVDLLRRRPLAQVLATRLRRMHAEEPETSFLVHIDGPWGSGKSTLLNFLRLELQRDWTAVEFNSWRQAHIGPPWWALIAALRNDIQGNLNPLARLRLRLAESWVRLRRAGAPFVLVTILLLAAAVAAFLALRPTGLTLQNAGNLAKTVTAIVTAVGTLWAGVLVAQCHLP